MQQRSIEATLSPTVRALRLSPTLAIDERCARMAHEGRTVYRLGLGQSPFPVPQSIVDELRANAHQKDYLPVRGLRTLREAVARWLHAGQGIERSGQDVLVGPGTKQLMFTLQLVFQGDLIVPSPAWVSYAPQARLAGRQVRWVNTTPQGGWRLLPGELDRVCAEDPRRPRALVLNYPANPTGASYELRELQELAAVARKHRVLVLSDEIYGELHHEGRHRSIARYYPEGTVVSTGLSKWCGAGGWRLGVFSFPPELRWLQDAMATVASHSWTATSAPIQYAAVRAFQGDMEVSQYLSRARRILHHLGRASWERLRATGARVTEPVGGFMLFPDLSPLREHLLARGVTDSASLCERLLDETGVAALPGVEFGRPAEELTMRLSYVDFDGARALEAARHVPEDRPLDATFLDQYCPNVVRAIDAIAAWMTD